MFANRRTILVFGPAAGRLIYVFPLFAVILAHVTAAVLLGLRATLLTGCDVYSVDSLNDLSAHHSFQRISRGRRHLVARAAANAAHDFNRRSLLQQPCANAALFYLDQIMAFHLQSTGKDDIQRDRIGTSKPRMRYINDRNPIRFALVAFVSLVLWRKIREPRTVLDGDVTIARLSYNARGRQSDQ